jgi:hypothetical protein
MERMTSDAPLKPKDISDRVLMQYVIERKLRVDHLIEAVRTGQVRLPLNKA